MNWTGTLSSTEIERNRGFKAPIEGDEHVQYSDECWKRLTSNGTSSSNGNLDKYELRIMDKIENRDKSNQLLLHQPHPYYWKSMILKHINFWILNMGDVWL